MRMGEKLGLGALADDIVRTLLRLRELRRAGGRRGEI
jgi:hypothetical protein